MTKIYNLPTATSFGATEEVNVLDGSSLISFYLQQSTKHEGTKQQSDEQQGIDGFDLTKTNYSRNK